MTEEDQSEKVTLAGHTNPSTPVSVGSLIAVYWPGEEKFYRGEVVSLDPEGKASIHYDDDDRLTHSLEMEVWEYARRNAKYPRKPRQSQAQAAARRTKKHAKKPKKPKKPKKHAKKPKTTGTKRTNSAGAGAGAGASCTPCAKVGANLPPLSLAGPSTQTSLKTVHGPTAFDEVRCELRALDSAPKLQRPALRTTGKLSVALLCQFVHQSLNLSETDTVLLRCSGEDLTDAMTLRDLVTHVWPESEGHMILEYKIARPLTEEDLA